MSNSEKLVYYYLRIACIKDGRKHAPRNKRQKTFSFRQNREAGLFLKLKHCR